MSFLSVISMLFTATEALVSRHFGSKVTACVDWEEEEEKRRDQVAPCSTGGRLSCQVTPASAYLAGVHLQVLRTIESDPRQPGKRPRMRPGGRIRMAQKETAGHVTASPRSTVSQ